MRHLSRLAGLAAIAAIGSFAAPAAAQYANEFTQAKLLKQGTTAKPIAGSGTVVVQVQVNSDGSHKAVRVIRSTNSGDNAAALDIAQNSTYRPAHRGSTPITDFYDFTLKFSGSSVSSASQGSGPVATGNVSPAAAQVAAMIRAGHYAEAKSKAQSELLSSPGDESLRQMLGIAAYDDGDVTMAAASFNKVTTIGKQFQAIAAASFAAAAVKGAQEDPEQSLEYAQKAVALNPDVNAHFALGVAQLANGQNADALASLKAARDAAMASPKLATSAKVNIDAELLQAYLANNDNAGAQTVAAEIKQLDPTSTAGSVAMASALLKAGAAQVLAKNTEAALKDFDQAAALGDPRIAVTANLQAAFAIAQSSKPDYKQMQAYADKALALKPDDAQANFAEGIALAGQWGASHDAGTKQKAIATLNKADQAAKAAGNEGLSLQIETFMKQSLNTTAGG